MAGIYIFPQAFFSRWWVVSPCCETGKNHTFVWYSSSHNHGSGNWPYCKGNKSWENLFIQLPWLWEDEKFQVICLTSNWQCQRCGTSGGHLSCSMRLRKIKTLTLISLGNSRKVPSIINLAEISTFRNFFGNLTKRRSVERHHAPGKQNIHVCKNLNSWNANHFFGASFFGACYAPGNWNIPWFSFCKVGYAIVSWSDLPWFLWRFFWFCVCVKDVYHLLPTWVYLTRCQMGVFLHDISSPIQLSNEKNMFFREK